MEEQRYVLLFKLLETSLLYRANVLFDRLEHWVHPINQQRKTFDEFPHLVPDLNKTKEGFIYILGWKVIHTTDFPISSPHQLRNLTLASEYLLHLKEGF